MSRGRREYGEACWSLAVRRSASLGEGLKSGAPGVRRLQPMCCHVDHPTSIFAVKGLCALAFLGMLPGSESCPCSMVLT